MLRRFNHAIDFLAEIEAKMNHLKALAVHIVKSEKFKIKYSNEFVSLKISIYSHRLCDACGSYSCLSLVVDIC